jgi:lysophospholipase L1-like esterase
MKVREKHPTLPIIMLSRPQDLNREALKARFEVVKATYDNAKARGDENVYLINGSTLFDGLDADYTVDAVHPNDLGFGRMAAAVAEILEKVLK